MFLLHALVTTLVLGSTAILAITDSRESRQAAPPVAAAQLPPRDKPATQPGTASIKGRITIAETGLPLRRARVVLQGSGPLDGRDTTTDLDGRYEFNDLAAGEYRVSASKGMFVGLTYGQRRPNEPGTPITVKDGQSQANINLALPRGGVIAGVLLDDVGDPAAGVRVSAMRQQFREGRRRLTPIGRPVETNDLGQYRIYGLPAGTYFVSALPASANPMIPMLSAPTGAPTYFPGTLSETEADRVVVRAARESTLPDFTLVPSRLAKVSGTATSPSGTPAQVVMLTSIAQADGASMPGMMTAMVRPDGSFQLNNVAPGEYMLMATVVNTGAAEPQMVSMPLTVAGEDITGITLQTTVGFRATGRISFEQSVPPADVTPASLMLVATPSSTEMAGSMARGTINDDWTFEIKGLAGKRSFRIAKGLPAGWMIQSVVHRGTDITDTPLQVTEDLDRITITLTDRPVHMKGSVADAQGRPATDATVVIFPADAALGPPASTRFLRAVRTGEDGRFEARGLPATTYMVVAVTSIETGEEQDPDLLEQLRSLATRVAVNWGDTPDLKLQLARFDR
jgi:hypothetical protein